MANTPTTPASVASRLTDEEILKLAKRYELTASQTVATDSVRRHYTISAAVLRDYVRLRRLANEIEDAFVKFAVEHEYRIIENADTRDMGREELANDENWQTLKRLLTEEG